jgi:uncharacterized phage-associated protein
MFTPFQLQKSVQAAAVVLRGESKKMGRLRLLKLLYLAERQCIKSGQPLIGGKLCVMTHGPLHSEVYDLIKGTHRHEAEWSTFIISKGPREVWLQHEPDMGKLSPFEVTILTDTVDKYAQIDDPTLVHLTHKLPEVVEKHPVAIAEGTSIALPLEELAAAVCPPEYEQEMIEYFKELAGSHATT